MTILESIYAGALQRCRPETVVEGSVDATMPRDVVAIGKCAGAMLDGAAAAMQIDSAFVAIPRGYPPPLFKQNVIVATGGHPDIDDSSFAACRRLVAYVEQCDDVLFLVSGGGSACVELPLEPWFSSAEVSDTNRLLVASGLPIGEMNIVRKHLSAIKGGRLAARVGGRSISLIYSDVSTGADADVASGPTLPDRSTNSDAARIVAGVGAAGIAKKLQDGSLPETVKRLANAESRMIADNGTLTAAAGAVARELGLRPVFWRGQVESDVQTAAGEIASAAQRLSEGEILIAGGEPTVVRKGSGKGGRCSELTVRFADATRTLDGSFTALFGSSDGVDGSSGVAGFVIDRTPRDLDRGQLQTALERSDSYSFAALLGRPIMIPPTGNNLRDLFLVTRDPGTVAHG